MSFGFNGRPQNPDTSFLRSFIGNRPIGSGSVPGFSFRPTDPTAITRLKGLLDSVGNQPVDNGFFNFPRGLGLGQVPRPTNPYQERSGGQDFAGSMTPNFGGMNRGGFQPLPNANPMGAQLQQLAHMMTNGQGMQSLDPYQQAARQARMQWQRQMPAAGARTGIQRPMF